MMSPLVNVQWLRAERVQAASHGTGEQGGTVWKEDAARLLGPASWEPTEGRRALSFLFAWKIKGLSLCPCSLPSEAHRSPGCWSDIISDLLSFHSNWVTRKKNAQEQPSNSHSYCAQEISLYNIRSGKLIDFYFLNSTLWHQGAEQLVHRQAKNIHYA